MTDRERFEKENPVPEGVLWFDDQQSYDIPHDIGELIGLVDIGKAIVDAKIQQAKFDGWKSKVNSVGSCNGCEHFIARRCTLPAPNNCVRDADDFHTGIGEQ